MYTCIILVPLFVTHTHDDLIFNVIYCIPIYKCIGGVASLVQDILNAMLLLQDGGNGAESMH